MQHIESHLHPGRPLCDPAGAPRQGLQAAADPVREGVDYCPDCLRQRRINDRDAERGRARLARTIHDPHAALTTPGAPDAPGGGAPNPRGA